MSIIGKKKVQSMNNASHEYFDYMYFYITNGVRSKGFRRNALYLW